MAIVRQVHDIACHYADGSTPHVAFRRLTAPGRSVQRPPSFLLGPANEGVLTEIFGEIATPEVGCYELNEAAVAPTGIGIMKDTAFCSWAFLQPPHHVVAVIDRLNAKALPERYITGTLAVIYGPAYETYGHWLTDFLPRLWVLHESGHVLSDLQFLVPPDLAPFAHELLALCGIGPEQLVRYAYWKEFLRCDRLLMPTVTRRGNRFSPCFAAATAFWRSLAPEARLAPGGTRLFVSRGDAPQQRQMVNRSEIEQIANRSGYVVVRPEQMSVRDQMDVFGRAAEIVGEYGSALHNSVFASPGTAVCGLRGTSRHPSFMQSGIATALDQTASYVFGATDGQDVAQRFRIDCGLFERALEMLALLRH